MQSSPLVPDYLVIGHVTKDVVTDGQFRPGGTATYAAAAAARLGLKTGVLTSVTEDVHPFPHNSVVMERFPSRQATVFENIYIGKTRKQYVRAVAGTLTVEQLPAVWRQTPIVHLGPVAQEVDAAFVDAFDDALVGVTPQGWLRCWDEEGLVYPCGWVDGERILDAVDVVVLSMEDLGHSEARLHEYIERARLLVLTIGEGGAIVYQDGRSERVPAFVVDEVEPTGAGDVFAAGYFIRYAQTRDAIEAARFANCVASFVVEGVGTSNVPTREQVEERLEHGRLRK